MDIDGVIASLDEHVADLMARSRLAMPAHVKTATRKLIELMDTDLRKQGPATLGVTSGDRTLTRILVELTYEGMYNAVDSLISEHKAISSTEGLAAQPISSWFIHNADEKSTGSLHIFTDGDQVISTLSDEGLETRCHRNPWSCVNSYAEAYVHSIAMGMRPTCLWCFEDDRPMVGVGSQVLDVDPDFDVVVNLWVCADRANCVSLQGSVAWDVKHRERVIRESENSWVTARTSFQLSGVTDESVMTARIMAAHERKADHLDHVNPLFLEAMESDTPVPPKAKQKAKAKPKKKGSKKKR